MATQRNLTQEERAEIVAKYNCGHSTSSLATLYSTSPHTIACALKNEGIKLLRGGFSAYQFSDTERFISIFFKQKRREFRLKWETYFD